MWKDRGLKSKWTYISGVFLSFPHGFHCYIEYILTLAALWLCSKHAKYSVDLCGCWFRAMQTRWTGELVWCGNPSRFSVFFSLLCFYLLMSGLCFWLARLPQSVNNDLAAAAAGHGCQALFPRLAFFHWLPGKRRFRFQPFSCHTTRRDPDIAFIELSSRYHQSLRLRASHLLNLLPCSKEVLSSAITDFCFLSSGLCEKLMKRADSDTGSVFF